MWSVADKIKIKELELEGKFEQYLNELERIKAENLNLLLDK